MADANTKRNALAELAKELERFSAENKGLFARRNHLILHKAKRIVAELAKANTCEHSVSGVDELIANCRAIAEEGAEK